MRRHGSPLKARRLLLVLAATCGLLLGGATGGQAQDEPPDGGEGTQDSTTTDGGAITGPSATGPTGEPGSGGPGGGGSGPGGGGDSGTTDTVVLPPTIPSTNRPPPRLRRPANRKQPPSTQPASPPAPAAAPPPAGSAFETVGAQSPSAGPNLLSPFPVVRIAGRLTARGARIRLLAVRAPAGVTIIALCRGRGCRTRTQRATVSGRASPTGRVRLRRLERTYRAGVRLEVFAVRAGHIGKHTRFRIRRRRAPARADLCVGPDDLRLPSACPR